MLARGGLLLRLSRYSVLELGAVARSMAAAASTAAHEAGTLNQHISVMFGPVMIHPNQVFFESERSYGFVNLRPLVPGHVLVIPKRVCARFTALTPEEVSDLYLAVHTIGPKLEEFFNGTALTISIQDGPAAGQTVPHVHVHVLPRKPGDFPRNDDVYKGLDRLNLKRNFDLDEDRPARTMEEMMNECAELRKLFPDNQPFVNLRQSIAADTDSSTGGEGLRGH